MPDDSPTQNPPRDFAVEVVQKLTAAGFEALWAGGCVRDDLLGIVPKDYDVATTATPQQVIDLFGKRRTVPVGVSFGVVMVLGPNRMCGQIEVATFRSDGEYLDGRRPETVEFCSAEEDAKRRDFTINGMFYDPLTDRVIDYVDGQKDLASKVVRAIGDATARFTEDKLRMLRAVRFAATYEFALDEATSLAISDLRHEITQVSSERIAQEIRRMLAHRTRAVSLQKLIDTNLNENVFPGIAGGEDPEYFDRAYECLRHLTEPAFEPALAVIFARTYDSSRSHRKQAEARVRAECRTLKLSNSESDTICWILNSAAKCSGAERRSLHIIKPILADDRVPLLLDYLKATSLAAGQKPADAEWLQAYLRKTPKDVLAPSRLIDGSDLQALGVAAGPIFKQLLNSIREEQLDEKLTDRSAALERLQVLATNQSDR